MPRDGLMRADTDTSLYADPKVKSLWRIVRPDTALMATAMCLYEVVRLDSARTGTRVTAGDAAPDWMLDVDRARRALVDAGLLDVEGRLSEHAFDTWIGSILDRVARGREYRAEQKRRQRDAHAQSHETDDDVSGDNDEVSRDNGAVSGSRARAQPASQPVQPVEPEIAREGRESRARAREDRDDDEYALQALAEEVTQQPYVLANLHSKLAEKALRQVKVHGIARVSSTWREIASDVGGLPTIRQVILGADDRLDPIPPATTSRAGIEQAEKREQDRRRRREAAALDEPWRRELRDKLADDAVH